VSGHGKCASAKLVPNMTMPAFKRCPHAEMRGCESGKVDRLNLVKEALGVKESDGIASNKTAKTVAYDADLGDVATICLDSGQLLLDFCDDALAATLDAIIGPITLITLDKEEIQFVGRMLLPNSLCNLVHVHRVAPESMDQYTEVICLWGATLKVHPGMHSREQAGRYDGRLC